jgi:phytoene dehydrogenase-like protein
VSRDGGVVVGAGPNGLVAAVTLARAGWPVTVLEAAARPGGGTRSEAFTLPGFVHDVCSAVHPLGIGSPAMRELPLSPDVLQWVQPDIPLAHPLDGGRAALLHRSLDETVADLGRDGPAYARLIEPIARKGLGIVDGALSPLAFPPRHPFAMARFGLLGVRSARSVAHGRFETDGARALLAGCAAHPMLPLASRLTGGFGLMLLALAHVVGWPFARGGSERIADALVTLLRHHGGEVVTDHRVTSLRELPPARAVLLDLTPRHVAQIAGDTLPARYRRRLERYRYGPGVFKVDWALDGPVPWACADVARAGTVHVGGRFDEIAAAEDDVHRGDHAERPFVLVAQPSVFDRSRAPEGKHTVWAYCHVPNGSTVDMTDRIEAQVERFAPGFRDRILARHVMDTAAMEAHDANYVGGDINSGVSDLRQHFARPVLSLHPWATPVRGLYLCSSATPPGGGVHGMCGLHAARLALRREKGATS